jgi:hypothetical protein
VGVLQRFERRLEGLVEGTFARIFGGEVQPVEIAAALQREAADKRAIVAAGRVLVPNSYVVELGPSDHERLTEYDAPLRAELAAMVREHADEQGWSFVGAVHIAFEQVESLDTGVFRVRSAVAADSRGASGPQTTGIGRPRLLVDGDPARTTLLARERTVIGRGAEADLRLSDTGVSRAHAEVVLDGDRMRLTDLRSTNGTLLNGRRIDTAALSDGDRIELGGSVLVFRSEG